MPPGWRPQAERLTALLRERWGADLVAVHVHGSAALGGWTPESDLDVLVVVRDSAVQDWSGLGAELLGVGPAALEISVVRAEAAMLAAPPWDFVLHVAHGPTRRVVLGTEVEGDPDLLLHFVVARASGVTMHGLPSAMVYGAVPPGDVRGALAAELTWALEHADERYAVLNACRAAVYARDEVVVSKIAGGEQVLAQPGLVGLDRIADLVREALEAQRRGRDLGPAGPRTATLVRRVRAMLLH